MPQLLKESRMAMVRKSWINLPALFTDDMVTFAMSLYGLYLKTGLLSMPALCNCTHFSFINTAIL
ncbi:MAG TPA: hypothetical protein DCR87_05670 [Acidobacteria bacterium]|nr:hypothetical protein [Acidobacteriota bacterium]